MIKFQPFVSPYLPEYKSITAVLVFDSLENTETMEEYKCEMIRLSAQWNDKTGNCVFFIDPTIPPQVASINPMFAAVSGVLSFPEDMEGMVHDFINVTLTQVHQVSPTNVGDEIMAEIEAAMSSPDKPTPSSEIAFIAEELSRIKSDKDVAAAHNCAVAIHQLSEITQDDYKFVESTPCGSKKLFTFVLSKLAQKIKS